jgi:hypothetical protein
MDDEPIETTFAERLLLAALAIIIVLWVIAMLGSLVV